MSLPPSAGLFFLPLEHVIVSQLTAFEGGESPQMASAGTEAYMGSLHESALSVRHQER